MPAALDQPPLPQEAALCAVADVLVAHIRAEKVRRGSKSEQAGEPLIVRLDGPGQSEMLDKLSSRLRPGAPAGTPDWTVVRFDAWQHQRLEAPWWWLVDALDDQIRADERSAAWHRHIASRLSHGAWHLRQLTRDFRLALACAGAALTLWLLAGQAMADVLAAAAKIVTAATVLVTAFASLRLITRSAPQARAADAHTGDPMADLHRRYAFLLGRVDASAIVLIDNLDRCNADYVVDLLEGLQTLLRHPGSTQRRFVTFVVAADRDWLCHSFLQRYPKFASTGRQPGRLFGQPFLDKVFDLQAGLPAIPAGLAISPAEQREADALFASASGEMGVREILDRHTHSGSTPGGTQARRQQALRIAAVTKIGQIELGSTKLVCEVSAQGQCDDTHKALTQLAQQLDAGAAMSNRLDTAYCVQRTRLLLGGHAIDAEGGAIWRLGLWSILAATWPLLANHLAANPDDIDALREGHDPSIPGDDVASPHSMHDASLVAEDLRAVFRNRAARQLAGGPHAFRLTAHHIRQYATTGTLADWAGPASDLPAQAAAA